MPAHRGVFPGQWGLPGGGVEDDERIEDALRREVREELQLELSTVQPIYFKGENREKLYPDGSRETMYMVFLIYLRTTDGADPVINEELEAFAWVSPDEMGSYDLNVATQATLREVGITSSFRAEPRSGGVEESQSSRSRCHSERREESRPSR